MGTRAGSLEFETARTAAGLAGAPLPEPDPSRTVRDLLTRRLEEICRGGRQPLLSVDLDDTFVPYGAPITRTEISLLRAYIEAGGHIVFNTLAPKEWFYRRVVDPLVSSYHQTGCTHLLSRVHWVASGGQEIFVYDLRNQTYRRIRTGSALGKAEGLLVLLRQLSMKVELLALYGDRFDDPGNDGNAIGVDAIALVINVGPDQNIQQSSKCQQFVNSSEKGPDATRKHLEFITARLREIAPTVPMTSERLPAGVRVTSGEPWRFGYTPTHPRAVEVHGPGFLWSWTKDGVSYLGPLLRSGTAYSAGLPDGAAGFTFFWTGGPETASGANAGRWEGRDFLIGAPAAP